MLDKEEEEGNVEGTIEHLPSINEGAAPMKKATKAEARRMRRILSNSEKAIGEDGCLACFQKMCEWSPPYDMDVVLARIKEVEEEMDIIRATPFDQIFVECKNAGSVKRGKKREKGKE